VQISVNSNNSEIIPRILMVSN